MSAEMDYIKRTYDVPADIGRRVVVNGKSGVIVGSSGPHLGVVFDGDKATRISPCHPTWRVEYLEMGELPKPTRSELRYQRYLEVGECFDSFRDFLKSKFSKV